MPAAGLVCGVVAARQPGVGELEAAAGHHGQHLPATPVDQTARAPALQVGNHGHNVVASLKAL
eukprot:11215470-Lingulodinium_polyedra.AAC.1